MSKPTPPTTSPEAGIYGWHAVPRALSTVVSSRSNPVAPAAINISDPVLALPGTPLAKQVLLHAQSHLPERTFNHSMRVFCFARAIHTTHFSSWPVDAETLLLTALLHDIGTTPANQLSTHLSFEFKGAIIALHLLTALHAPQAQAEAVCETIIRHQDVAGETGMVAALTALILFATLLDNAGRWVELVHKDTIEAVVRRWPRKGWTGCFADVIRKEIEAKPWSNSTRIEGFAEIIEGNVVMRPYD